jgi:hypothetical protein
MKYYLFVCFAALGISVKAQQKYDAALIPKEILPYASAVMRSSEVNYEVKSFDYSTYRVKKAITVLNSSGDEAAHIVIWYDKIRTIKNLKGQIFDASGMPAGKISEKNFLDVYGGSDYSLYEDSRIKHYTPAVVTYPYTIEYECEIRAKETLVFDAWMPARMAGVAVESSTFTFSCITAFDIRYKEANMPVKVVTAVNADGLKTYTWKINNLKATKLEPYSPEIDKILPVVRIAPAKFTYGGMDGQFTNWQQLGKWEYDKLLAGRDALSPQTVSYIKELIQNISDTKQKAKKIYEYMQQKTRYISVQVGIGGFQPYPAADVDRLNYGDCKGLVNYTHALLKVANIESYYCVVESGDRKVGMDPDFADMSQGNHIILCLPFKNDTTFLECTSQQIPFGYLGDFTDDRLVLACTPQGGKLLHTPKYTADENLQARKATFTIDNEGSLKGSMNTVFKGTQYENREGIIQEPQAERIKTFKKIYAINNMEIQKLDLNQDKSQQPVTNEAMNILAYDYASKSNGKLYFTPNIANRRTSPLRDVSNRKNPVYINRGYTDEDEITYTLPAGYKPENDTFNISIDKPFGKYTATTIVKDNQLIYKRSIKLIEGTYSKETYADLVNFYQSIVDADQHNVILSKGE